MIRASSADCCLQVKILYVRNLMLSTTEESLRRLFANAVSDKLSLMTDKSSTGVASSTDRDGAVIERVKKIRDYAFIHFRHRELALTAMDRLNGLLNLPSSPRLAFIKINGRFAPLSV